MRAIQIIGKITVARFGFHRKAKSGAFGLSTRDFKCSKTRLIAQTSRSLLRSYQHAIAGHKAVYQITWVDAHEAHDGSGTNT
jgi:hypothetical protein